MIASFKPTPRKFSVLAAGLIVLLAAVTLTNAQPKDAGEPVEQTDLVVKLEKSSVNYEPEAGVHYIVVSIKNQGVITSDKCNVQFYRIGSDGTPKPLTRGIHSAGPIKPGDTWNERSSSFALREGTNKLIAVVDPKNTLSETDENNNKMSYTIVVDGGQVISQSIAVKTATAFASANSTPSNVIYMYSIDRSVADFPLKEDFSTPEAAYATINRVSTSGEPGGWARVSIKKLASRLKDAKTTVSPDWAEVLLNANLVRVYHRNNEYAMVIAYLSPQVLGEPANIPQGGDASSALGQKIHKPYDLRALKLEDGRWLNAGNDRADSLNQSYDIFKRMTRHWPNQNIADTQIDTMQHSDEIEAAARKLLEAIRDADYASFAKGKRWGNCPTSGYYEAMKWHDALAGWISETFSQNPIVKIELGSVFINEKKMPAVPYTLTLKDGKTLKGNLPFKNERTKDGGKWHAAWGIDWHLMDDPYANR